MEICFYRSLDLFSLLSEPSPLPEGPVALGNNKLTALLPLVKHINLYLNFVLYR